MPTLAPTPSIFARLALPARAAAPWHAGLLAVLLASPPAAAHPGAAGGSGAAPTAALAAAAGEANKAADAKATQAKKTVGALVNAIRFDKRSLGEKHLGFATMAAHLLGPSYGQMSSAERSQFIADFKVLLVNTAFPKGHELFRYLDGVLYGRAREDKGQVVLPSTIVVHRNVKKTEMQVDWVLVEEDGALKVVDVVSMNDSTCDGIRDEEVAPLVREGGMAKLLSTLHERAAAAAKQGGK